MPGARDPAAVRADAEALDWIVALQDQPDHEGLRHRFELWRTASRQNAAAWEEAAGVYVAIGQTTPEAVRRWQGLTPRREPSLAPPILASYHRCRGNPAISRRNPRRRRHIVIAILPVAAAAVFAIVGLPDAMARWQADVVT